MTDPMTAADLDAIEQRANAATEGPWEAPAHDHAAWDVPILDRTGHYLAICPDCGVRGGHERADAEFIAHARDDVPRLLAEVRRLRSADEQVRALHHPVEIEPSDTVCGECSYRMPNGRYLPVVEHPCPTIAALDGGER